VQHDFLVSGIDWHPVTNKIVTCSHDRNAFVWNLDAAKDEWKATVVIAGLDRAALAVKWSPDGAKFALASSNKNVTLCWFDPAGNWYINQTCKREKAKSTCKSSVVSLAWHPNNQVLAVSSTDYRCRVLFAFLEATDKSGPAPAPFAGSWESGDAIAEWEMTKAWVNDAQWSPSGSELAFIGQDGMLHVASFGAGGEEAATFSLKTTGLPGNVLLWLSDRSIVVGGHSMNPEIYVKAGGAWKSAGSADVKVR
jgi:actin related protein 2/3 complex subunit 1A/1B